MLFRILLIALGLIVAATVSTAQPARVLWWNGTPDYPPQSYAHHRQTMANFLTGYRGGGVFEATFQTSLRGGELAAHLSGRNYDVIVLDLTSLNQILNQSDLEAIKSFYASGRTALMFDGSLWIRSTAINATTNFPGQNGATGNLLVNQISAIARNGGGILFGTDHDQYQTNANAATQAILPGIGFTGYTIPSTDGEFIGDTLLREREPVIASDILRHWDSIPSQGEAPVGTFQDFMGRPVTLYSLVETADKPGGGRKRPYVSASFDPGERRTAIDAETEDFGKIPTRRGP